MPVTEESSGADEITYTVTPEGGSTESRTAGIRNGSADITVSADFKGTISIAYTDKTGNTSSSSVDSPETPQPKESSEDKQETTSDTQDNGQADGTEGNHQCGLSHICPTFLGICYFIWLVIIIAILIIIWIVMRGSNRSNFYHK